METVFKRMETHMNFICPECGEVFQTQQLWRHHLNFHHDYLCKTPEDLGFVDINDRYHECLECNQLVSDGKRAIAILQYHKFMHLPHNRTYGCRHCKASFMRKRALCEHLCRNHEKIVGEKLVAAVLRSPFFSKPRENTKRPVNVKENPEFYVRYICPQCGKFIETLNQWMEHIKTEHSRTMRNDYAMQRVAGTKNHYCKICRKVLYTNELAKLQRHFFCHMPHKVTFVCAYCKVRRPYKTELLHHFIKTHLREFETHRKLMRKPIEFGAEVNEQLDKELDFLLKHGNSIGGQRGTKSFRRTPTATTSSAKRNSETERQTVKSDIIQSALVNSLIDLDKETAAKPYRVAKRRKTPSQDIKKELDALCAEIFKDIDEEVGEQSSSGLETLTNLYNDTNQTSTDETLDAKHDYANNISSEEHIVSIEINALDENELSQLNETQKRFVDVTPQQAAKRRKLNDETIKECRATDKETYPTLKLFYNAQVLHLCPKCGMSFTQQLKWRDHVLTAHDNLSEVIEKNFVLLDDECSNQCITCKSILHTTEKSELQRHHFTHMPYHAYLKCKLCEKCKTNKSKMLHHLETNHGEFLYDNSQATAKESENIRNEKVETKEEFFAMMSHLKRARDRLNTIAARYDITPLQKL